MQEKYDLKITSETARVLIEKFKKGHERVKIEEILNKVKNEEELNIIKLICRERKDSIFSIARRIIKEIYNMYRNIRKVPIPVHVLKIISEYVFPKTLEEYVQYITYISLVEDLYIGDNYELCIECSRLPISSIEIISKIRQFADININIKNDSPILTLHVKNSLYSFYEEFLRRLLNPNIVISELIDLIILDFEYNNIRKYVDNLERISRYLYNRVSNTIARILTCSLVEKLIHILSISSEVTIIDLNSGRIMGRMSILDMYNDKIVVESLSKLVKVNNYLIIWHS